VSAAPALSPYPIDQEARRTAPVPESVAEKVRVGGSATIRVVATSMFPWIRPGDQAFVRRYDFFQINSGDVILYERANRLFVHRVIGRITRPGLGGAVSLLVVKGDALDRPMRRCQLRSSWGGRSESTEESAISTCNRFRKRQ